MADVATRADRMTLMATFIDGRSFFIDSNDGFSPVGLSNDEHFARQRSVMLALRETMLNLPGCSSAVLTASARVEWEVES